MKSRLLKYLIVLFLVEMSTFGYAQVCRFWDGIEDFDGPTDHNPVMEAQIDYYFDSLVSPLPDSICKEINRLLERQISTELRDLILWHLLDKYQHPIYMTQDQVFVFLFDNYFSELEITDLNELNYSMIAEKAHRIRRLQLFNTAPNFEGKDVRGTSFRLNQLDSNYIVLFFFDHDCALCNEDMRKLEKMRLPETKIVAIDTNLDQKHYDDNFIHINLFDIHEDLFELYDIETTPLIYVLDSQKHIIGKKICVEQINSIIQ